MLKNLTVFSILFSSLLLPISAFGQSESGELYPIVQGGKEGYIDRTGRIVVEPQFDIAYYFSEGLGLIATASKRDVDGQVVKIPQKWGVINALGKVVVQPQFRSTGCVFSEGLLCHGTEQGVGFINRTGKLVIESGFSQAKDFSEGLAAVKLGEMCAYIG